MVQTVLLTVEFPNCSLTRWSMPLMWSCWSSTSLSCAEAVSHGPGEHRTSPVARGQGVDVVDGWTSRSHGAGGFLCRLNL